MPYKLLFLPIIILTTTSCNVNDEPADTTNENEKNVKQYKWEKAKTPTTKAPQIYGGYTNGCIDGAISLPEFGKGYIAANAKNERLYGHPSLINMIEELSSKMKDNYGKTLQIGDLGQARGGPAPLHTSAHRSHQNGLDVDIWYRHLEKDKITEEDIHPKSVLTFFKGNLNKKYWDQSHYEMLRITAEFKDVERILVNPHVKKAMCKKYSDKKWIHKLRPWWGHDKHFHVRLKCPKYNRNCTKQAPVPNEDSCAEPLDWWFSKEAKSLGKSKKTTRRTYPNLPEQCENVWAWKPS